MPSGANLGDNCTYTSLGPLLTGSLTNNITIYINGPLLSGRDLQSSDNNWSFQFNQFMCVLQVIFWWQLTNVSFLLVLGNRLLRVQVPVRPLRRCSVPPKKINHRWLFYGLWHPFCWQYYSGHELEVIVLFSGHFRWLKIRVHVYLSACIPIRKYVSTVEK